MQKLSEIPEFRPSLITSGRATSILDPVPTKYRVMVLIAYNEALRKIFLVRLIVSCLAVLGTALLEWRSVLKKPEANIGAEKSGAAKEKVRQTA